MTGIWAPMVMTKKVCQRLADQVSSLRWVLICPSQIIGLKKRIHLGVSSSWDSRTVISVRSTESSTVVTMCCCESRLNCSARHESVNKSLRSRKGYQWLSICWVTLCCEGMTVTEQGMISSFFLGIDWFDYAALLGSWAWLSKHLIISQRSGLDYQALW